MLKALSTSPPPVGTLQHSISLSLYKTYLTDIQKYNLIWPYLFELFETDILRVFHFIITIYPLGLFVQSSIVFLFPIILHLLFLHSIFLFHCISFLIRLELAVIKFLFGIVSIVFASEWQKLFQCLTFRF